MLKSNPSSVCVRNCYDSHVHWLGYAEMQNRTKLSHVHSLKDLKNLKDKKFRGDWLLGFGWDDSLWSQSESPLRKHLDDINQNKPICFLKADGHTIWVNTKALQLCGFLDNEAQPTSYFYSKIKNSYQISENDLITGVFVEKKGDPIRKFIPSRTDKEIKDELLLSTKLFHQRGFTHIRDMSCNFLQWNLALELYDKKELFLCVEEFFYCNDLNKFDNFIKFIQQAKKEAPPFLKAIGIKIFYDGSLGSETAYLSETYKSQSGKGLQLFSLKELEEILIKTWEQNLEVAVHTIGDEASYQLVKIADRLSSKGISGKLHLEHVQLLRPETIDLMKGKNICCHMQPSHWLSDKDWLSYKISEKLFSYLFCWRLLQESKIDFYFGSDAPITDPSIFQNYKAIKDAEASGILPPSDFFFHHEHPDKSWVKDTYTNFNSKGEVEEVYFLGQKINL